MIEQETQNKLTAMKLLGMLQGLRRQEEQRADWNSLSFAERFGMLVDEEWTWREDRKLANRLQKAKLRQSASLEDVDYQDGRGLSKSEIRQLARCAWVKNHQSVLITGATGVGKSFLACALASQACREGHTALYTRVPRLMRDLEVGRRDGSYTTQLKRFAKVDVLVLDDWGLAPMEDVGRRDLLEVLEEQNGRGALIVTSQLPVKTWHGIIGDSTIADAIMDRIINHAHRLELKGESMRKKKRPVAAGKAEE